MPQQEQSIEVLVNQLPEVYQPIFKHPEFTAQASRSCIDRLETIISIYEYISKEKGRPLKVLDLGCAQGFFSLSLAEKGAIVTAVDYSQPNINTCNKLFDENKNFKIEFVLGSIETIINERVNTDNYDLVLGLSVFHHLIYEHGQEYVINLFKILSEKVETAIFEFALKTEPLYWADVQPEDPRRLIESYTFTHQLSVHETHLSEIVRPLFFASNKYWNIDEHYGVIDCFTSKSHQLDNNYHSGNRFYYFSNQKIIKKHLANNCNSRHEELIHEADFLKNEIPGFRAAKLICNGRNETESWLIRTAIPGRLLLDSIIAGDDFDDQIIIAEILEQLTLLESYGLYHNDLRLWNILLGDDKKTYLIDYGSISNHPSDGDDLYGQILSFLVLIKEIALHKCRTQGSQRPNFISPNDFPEKYQKWISKVWMLPSQEWTFKNIFTAYSETDDTAKEIPVSAIMESYLSTEANSRNWQINQLEKKITHRLDDALQYIKEEHIKTTSEFIRKEESDIKRTNQNLMEIFKKIEILNEQYVETIDANQKCMIAKLDEYANMLNNKLSDFSKKICELHAQKNISENLQGQLDSIYKSNSWKITYPLRVISRFIRMMVHPKKLAHHLNIRPTTRIVNFINNHPRLRQRLIRTLNRHPNLKYKIKRKLIRNHPDGSFPSNISDIPSFKAEPCHPRHFKDMGVNEAQKSVLESWFN